MEVVLRVSMNLSKPVGIAAVSNGIRVLGLEKLALKALLEEEQKRLVDEACGARYSRGNEEKPCERAGTRTRTVSTLLGAVEVSVVKVRDRATGKVTTPLWDRVQLAGRRLYQDDVLVVGCELVTKMTYRDAVMEAKRFQSEFPSRHTLQRRLPEYGLELDLRNHKQTGFRTLHADGTKVRSTQPRGHHDVNVVLGEKDGEKRLLRVSVGESWNRVAERVKTQVEKNAVVVADGETSIRDAFHELDLPVQQCLIHALRNIGYAMWKDGATREQVKNVKKELATLLLILRRSVLKHTKDKDYARLEWRVNKTKSELRQLAEDLSWNGWTTAGAFLRNEADAIVLFARLAPQRSDVPWTTNLVERIMGEISKRVKHKWMHWSDMGLDVLLNMLLTRLKNPDIYDEWWNEKMRAHEKTDFTVEVLSTLVQAEA